MSTLVEREQAELEVLAATSGRRAKPPKVRRRKGENLWGWLFAIPTIGGVLIFYIWPMLKTGYYSFTHWGAFGSSVEWAGLDNYARLAQDPYMGKAILNTIIYTAIVLLGIPLGVVLASLINRPGLKYAQIYRVAFFMPYIAMPSAVALVWRMIYKGDFGILNQFLAIFGIKGPGWVTTPGFALVAVGILGLWSNMGFIMLILSAGLKAIPRELYEAAALDGAGNGRQFWSITLPLLTPSIFFITVITTIGGLQLFDTMFALLGGKSNPALIDTQSLVYLFYNNAFILNDKGYSSAIAVFILLLVGVLTAVQFWGQKKWVNYV